MVQLLDSDQELYRNFPLTISERWQQEVAETVFDTINAETDRLEARKKTKNKQLGHEEGEGLWLSWVPTAHVREEKQTRVSGTRPRSWPGSSQTRIPTWAGPLSLSLAADYALGKDCIMHGYMSKMGNPFLTQWQRRYFYLFPNRLEWRGEGEAPVRIWARGHGAGAGRGWPVPSHTLPAPPCPAAEPADHGGDPVGGGDADQGAEVPAAQDPQR